MYVSRPRSINPLYIGNPRTGSLANSEDSDEMPHNAAFHQGLHCLLRFISSGSTLFAKI